MALRMINGRARLAGHYLDEPRNEAANPRLKPPRRAPKNRVVGGALLRRRRQAVLYES